MNDPLPLRAFLICIAAVMAACPTGGAGSDDDDDDAPLENEMVLEDASAEDCERSLYWPAAISHFPVGAFEVEAPAPPYEITGFSAVFYEADAAFGGGRDCDPTVAIRVFAFLLDDDPSVQEPDAEDYPEFDVLAEAILTGDTGDTWTDGSVDLDTPVRVESGTTLWLGYDAGLDAGSSAGACLAGCTDVPGPMWTYMVDGNWFSAEEGWQERTESNVLISAHIRH